MRRYLISTVSIETNQQLTWPRGITQKGKHTNLLCVKKNWDILYIIYHKEMICVSREPLRTGGTGLQTILSLTLPYFSPTSIILFVLEILSAVNGWRPGI